VTPTTRRKRLGRPPATDSDVTRQRIIEAAQRHFGEKGYERATNGDIARELDLTSGSIYHHFGSKAQLYVAACEDARATTVAFLEEAVAGRSSLISRLTAILESAVDLNRQQPSFSRFLTSAPGEARQHPELGMAVAAYMTELAGFVGRLIDEAMAAGEIAEHANPASVVCLIQAMMLGLAQFAAAAPEGALPDVMAQCERLISGTLFTAAQPIVRSVGQ